jgi:hypothetical protein
LSEVCEKEYRTLFSTLKSCSRFFDVVCIPCDKIAGSKARRDWAASVALDPGFDPTRSTDWSDDPMGELVQRVRSLVGTHWGRRMQRFRDSCLVPDQNGCKETKVGEGGTLGTAPDEYSSDRWGLRVGVAKTKGKIRTVTMQSAYVKGTLRPVHECLYDFLSSSRWLVKGDVTKDHVRSVVDGCMKGESFISGDYEAATNNIFVQIPWAIAQELSLSPDLSHEEREALLESFRPDNLHWVSSKGVSSPIRRGSMMGNLMSFPMLCLLNKACYDMCCSIRRKRDKKLRLENCIINGDDIAFAGDTPFYNDWVRVTSFFGLVVNLEKTGISSTFIELNSRVFFSKGRVLRLLRKPVLSALSPGLDPSCLLTRLWDGLRSLSPGTFRWMSVMLRHNIIERGVCLSSIPSRLRRVLIKYSWFRRAILSRADVVESGVLRAWPVCSQTVRPSAGTLDLFNDKMKELSIYGVSLAIGLKVPPYKRELRRRVVPVRPKGLERPYIRFRTSWVWRWPAPLYRWWISSGLPLRQLDPSSVWEDDHSCLSVSVVAIPYYSLPPPPCPIGCEPFGGGHLISCLSG